ncbi:MAG: glycerol-3-phosphate dehydrogenase/oxidase [Bacteroidia bacterium]
MNTFSVKNRSTQLSQMAQNSYDILVIGGGITGAGIALDAALRGWKVALVEKGDFASGTSSRSTKLIHGGLRYLKQLEIKLVHETGTERAILHQNAPHLVRPEDMLLPIIEGGSLGSWSTGFALWVYDRLAGVKSEEGFEMLSKEQTLEYEPLFRQDLLKSGAIYTEYRTDDARLTLEIMKSAVKEGAICMNYTQVSDFVTENGKVTGVKVKDILQNKEQTLLAKCVINAAGPWVDTLREKDNSLTGKRLHLTKGVHLVVPHARLPLRQSVYFDVLDGRMMFAIPRDEKVYLGTTDTHYQAEIDKPTTTKSDADYILKAINAMFPTANLSLADVESSWAGLRPLIHEEGKSPSELSRKDEIFVSDSGLISIAGGKLTGYRKMAERVVDLVGEKLGGKGICKTEHYKLCGSNYENPDQISQFGMKMYQKFGKLIPTMKYIVYLNRTYGTQTEAILTYALQFHAEGMNNELAPLAGEIQFCLENEMTATLSDFFIRRTGMLYFQRPEILPLLDFVIERFRLFFEWNEEIMQQQKATFLQGYEQVLKFEE